MERRLKGERTKDGDFDLDSLLHPAHAFKHPSQVVADPDLTLNEKRAILASWASDACAVEASPELRVTPNGSGVRFDDIMDALRELDGQLANTPKYRKFIRRAQILRHFAGGDGGEPTLN
ncbi:MAG: hypothetical protein ACR2K5_03040 [Pseudolabrys sp.]